MSERKSTPIDDADRRVLNLLRLLAERGEAYSSQDFETAKAKAPPPVIEVPPAPPAEALPEEPPRRRLPKRLMPLPGEPDPRRD